MNQTHEVVLQNEWSKVIGSSINLFGVIVILVATIIFLSSNYKSYILATENISI
ncbi:hypothetical protein JOC27_000535 [Sporolactobacillus spathodeae]|uniref:Uncharacterized protein n=1 Tax=Sporolactobacillus spathodeae TaxID=1465502 RepID=A0ABS2Q5M8_9BACL|nr:hypothetical protein [Sporolactobacillus spathodeae]